MPRLRCEGRSDAAVVCHARCQPIPSTKPRRQFNDHRARLVGIAEASAPFATFPVFFTRYTQALRYVGRERNLLSYVLVQADAPVTEVAARIQARTDLSATTTEGFSWQTIGFYLANTGIPVNFGIHDCAVAGLLTASAGDSLVLEPAVVFRGHLRAALALHQGRLGRAKARVRTAEARLADARERLQFAERVQNPLVISAEELSGRRMASGPWRRASMRQSSGGGRRSRSPHRRDRERA